MDAAKIRGHDAFISKGFDCWKHALSTDRGFTKHEVSDLHQTCTEMLANRQGQLDDSVAHPSIAGSLSAAFHEHQLQREKELSENRKYWSAHSYNAISDETGPGVSWLPRI